ncbi:hypothetical protein [Streptomyces blattellae]|uniref:hypothetical protein n=1 Tax=Streptomyces blattellae TaxID=2569855 RepID=UPI0012B6BC91|nr:hypothetical protein [Streptomyces blattellae]
MRNTVSEEYRPHPDAVASFALPDASVSCPSRRPAADRLLAYEAATGRAMVGHLTSAGFRELTRADRR